LLQISAQARFVLILELEGKNAYLIFGLTRQAERNRPDDRALHADGWPAAGEVDFCGRRRGLDSWLVGDRAGPEETHVPRLSLKLSVVGADPDWEGDAEPDPSSAFGVVGESLPP